MDDQELSADKLILADKPSLYITGMLVANSIKTHGIAVISVDDQGKVILLPATVVDEDKVIKTMLEAGKTDEQIVKILNGIKNNG